MPSLYSQGLDNPSLHFICGELFNWLVPESCLTQKPFHLPLGKGNLHVPNLDLNHNIHHLYKILRGFNLPSQENLKSLSCLGGDDKVPVFMRDIFESIQL